MNYECKEAMENVKDFVVNQGWLQFISEYNMENYFYKVVSDFINESNLELGSKEFKRKLHLTLSMEISLKQLEVTKLMLESSKKKLSADCKLFQKTKTALSESIIF